MNVKSLLKHLLMVGWVLVVCGLAGFAVWLIYLDYCREMAKSRTYLAASQQPKLVRVSCAFDRSVSDEKIDDLLKLNKVEDLDLSYTAVTDVGVKKLAALTDLTRLSWRERP